jgi:Xaa-Pro aminopeptidase
MSSGSQARTLRREAASLSASAVYSISEETHCNGINIDDFETRDSRRITPDVCFSIEPGIYFEGQFGVRSEINVYVSDKDIEVTGRPIQTEIIPILQTR